MKKIFLVFIVMMFSISMEAKEPPITKNLRVPARGFISSQPAATWQQGLIAGNGTIGANVLSRPLDEIIIFTHERLFLPKGPPVMPPLIAPRLFEIRRLIDRELYGQATQLAFDLSEQEGFMYPDPFIPAFDLNIRMDTEEEISNYMRSVDFQTGEITVHWADSSGVYERRLFVSRKHGVAVLLISGPDHGVSCRLRLKTREPSPKLDPRKLKNSARVFQKNITDIDITAEHSALTLRNSFAQAYPGSIHALEGVVRVFVKNGTASPEGETLIVKGANRVMMFIDIRMIYDPKKSCIEDTKKSLAALPPDYSSLLKEHARIHGELFNRVKLDIGGWI